MSVNNKVKAEIKSNNIFSGFGQYQIDGKTTLNLPNHTITIQDIGNGKFSYTRIFGETIVKKIIQSDTQKAQIEIAPALPIHVPSYKTDFFFIRFDETLFITQGSPMQIDVFMPIEIGVFIITKNKPSGFDFFSCDPSNSRFGLYGTPEEGRICKYSLVSANGRDNPQPYMHAHFRIEIVNELHELVRIGKIVFPITDHDLYYRGNEVIMDGLRATIKNRVGLHIIETVQESIATPHDLVLAVRDIEKTDYKFSMEWGFE